MKAVKILLTFTAALFGLICLRYPALQKAQTRTPQTSDQLSNWRPFNEARDIKYVGTQTCLQCHSKDAQTQSPMAHASLRPADSEVLKANPVLKFRNGS